ncbi:MAG: hypothetical protein J5884_06110 [Paludibacteraceae bacterium]|nr:hypothetical protein [Paludibacteraceae bacterium]
MLTACAAHISSAKNCSTRAQMSSYHEGHADREEPEYDSGLMDGAEPMLINGVERAIVSP